MIAPLDPDYAPIVVVTRPALGIDITQFPAHEAVRKMRAAIGTISSINDPEIDVDDRAAPGFGADVLVRIYRPRSASFKGVLVNFHGGGWIVGSAEMDDERCHALAKAADCNIVSVSYRLAPEHPFPTPLEDCYSVVSWVADNAKSLGFDRDRIAVGGVSAGANLAAATTLLARDRRGPTLAFQHLLVPVTDADFSRASYNKYGEGYITTRAVMSWFWDQYAHSQDDRQNPYAAPFRALDLSKLPPALIQTAECDPLCDEGEAYAKRLADAGVTVTCTRYAGVPHGFIAMGLHLNKGRIAMDEAAAALKIKLSG
jgi:acetyl esterase